MIQWTCTKGEIQTIAKIAMRACDIATAARIAFDYQSTLMDLEACHSNGMPLKLDELLKATDADFGHDVFGISRFINRETGQMESGFVPRYAKS